MIAVSTLRGYLLEEVLAWLLRGSGYRLLDNAAQDPAELVEQNGALRVRGRGATHQVDVLGELLFTPAFSLPVRLFLEAKFTTGRCGLEIVRNAHGVLYDVNQHHVPRAGSRRPERRFQYNYALFSTGGFTPDAQRYAIAHQISLIDLSGANFAWLRDPIHTAATDLHAAATAPEHGLGSFPVPWVRSMLRTHLQTAEEPAHPDANPTFAEAARPCVRQLAGSLLEHADAQLLLGFPAAPFILALGSTDAGRFIRYANQRPTHDVLIKRIGRGKASRWILSPAGEPSAYELTFNLPPRIEAWIVENEEQRVDRARKIKSAMFSTMTIYGQFDGHERVYLLQYTPSQLGQ